MAQNDTMQSAKSNAAAILVVAVALVGLAFMAAPSVLQSGDYGFLRQIGLILIMLAAPIPSLAHHIERGIFTLEHLVVVMVGYMIVGACISVIVIDALKPGLFE